MSAQNVIIVWSKNKILFILSSEVVILWKMKNKNYSITEVRLFLS